VHTDGTDWPEPNDYTCLLCAQPDASDGGASRLVSREGLVERVASTIGPEVIDLLRSVPVPSTIAPELGGGTCWRPVLDEQQVRWLLYTVDDDAFVAARGPEAEDVLGVLGEVERVVDSAETLDFAMQVGGHVPPAEFERRWLQANTRTTLSGSQSDDGVRGGSKAQEKPDPEQLLLGLVEG
jgi:hypothetical protein